MFLSAKKIICVSLCYFSLLFYVFSENGVKSKTLIQLKTENIDRGCLVGKRGINVLLDVVVQKKSNGIYGTLDVFSPLQGKDLFSDRWKMSGGFLKKITEHFTWDLGIQYTFLKRLGFERIKHWQEIYTGIQSDLLMQPSFYFFWDQDRRQKCFEIKFSHEFDLSVFDWNNLSLIWENMVGILKARKPYGQIENGNLNRRHKYWYVQTAFLLKSNCRENLILEMGPVFAYNTGGVQAWTIVNRATYHSHFSGFIFRLGYCF